MTGNENDNKDAGKRNPWGNQGSQNQDDGKGPSPWGSRQAGRPGDNRGDIPDLSDILRQARSVLPNGSGAAFVMIIAILFGLWLVSGVYRVQPGENAVIKRFGDFTRVQQQPGLGYAIPWPIESVTKLNVMIDRRIQVGFAENVTGAGRRDVEEESLMLTADANIVDIDVVVLWNIAESEKFLFNIRDPETTIKQVAESAIREEVGQTRLQSIITEGRDDVAARILKTIQGILDSYGSGVAIKQVLILEATVHPDVLEAYNDVAAARQDAERFQNEAMIYRNDILPKARGEAIKMEQDSEAYAQDVVARAKGDAERFTEILAAYNTGKDVTRSRLYIETMEQILSSANRMVIDQSAGQGVLPYLPLDGVKRPAPQQPQLGQ